MAQILTVNDVLEGHVILDAECLDRIYLNSYVPKLQVAGQVVGFMTRHLGLPIPSPAVMEKIGTRFRRAVNTFAADNHIPVVRFEKADRKIDRMAPYVRAQAKTGRSGVAAIGIAQEYQNVFATSQRQDRGDTGNQVWFSFYKADRRVTCFYFYLWDVDFGPAFIKVCAYFPYPAKVWLNGHEWAKRQATHAGIGFTELSNGFATCTDPAGLQAICDRLGPGPINVFFERWMSILPLPLTPADREAGYLVGTVDATGRDLSHHRLRRTQARPPLLRSPGGRQPRHRPTRPRPPCHDRVECRAVASRLVVPRLILRPPLRRRVGDVGGPLRVLLRVEPDEACLHASRTECLDAA